jgi:hypothetical protein
METFDVAIVGGGPAGSSCAAFCALAGLRTLVLDREKFPREKVCGDCLNPSCWPVLERLDVVQRVLDLPHSKLSSVEFIAIDGHKVIVPLPSGADCEISVKRSRFAISAEAYAESAHLVEQTTAPDSDPWRLGKRNRFGPNFHARSGSGGRNNSTVARLCDLLRRPRRAEAIGARAATAGF